MQFAWLLLCARDCPSCWLGTAPGKETRVMMWKPRTYLILVGLAILGLVLASHMTAQPPASQAPPRQQGQRPPAPPPLDVQAVQQLHQAYSGLELVSVWSSTGKGKLAQDQAALFEQAKDL